MSQPCVLCGADDACEALCPGCRADLPLLPHHACVRCAAPLPSGRLCGACIAHPPRYDSVRAAYVYDFPLDALIRKYKYAGELRLARLLGTALASSGGREVDVLVPMPLSEVRLRARGYNQALEIARIAGRLHELPVRPAACRRVRDTPAQALLPWRERPRNVRGAFVCDADVRGLRIGVVDDVMTTGATLNELARNLKRAGAAEVHGWMVARAVARAFRRSSDAFE